MGMALSSQSSPIRYAAPTLPPAQYSYTSSAGVGGGQLHTSQHPSHPQTFTLQQTTYAMAAQPVGNTVQQQYTSNVHMVSDGNAG
jgi:hypothetical protein